MVLWDGLVFKVNMDCILSGSVPQTPFDLEQTKIWGKIYIHLNECQEETGEQKQLCNYGDTGVECSCWSRLEAFCLWNLSAGYFLVMLFFPLNFVTYMCFLLMYSCTIFYKLQVYNIMIQKF